VSQSLTRNNAPKIFWLGTLLGTLLGTYEAHTAAMTNLHSARYGSRVRPRATTAGTWPPETDKAPAGSPPAVPAEDPMSLVAGHRLALTVTEAASVLGISRALAYELVARGELPSIRLGRRLVVPKVALLQMLGLSPRREG
jgi:excisionase family DNA binding protein